MPTTKKAKPKQSATQTNGTQQGINKMDAVKAALDQLGNNARPLDIKGFVKQKFDMDLSMDLIHNYKHLLTKKKGKKGKGKMRGGSKSKAETPPQPQAARRTKGKAGGGISLQDITMVRDLKSRLGAANLHSLIEMVR